MAILDFIIERLSERSTWLSLITLLTVIGVGLSPEEQEAIVGLGLAAASAVGIFTKDQKPVEVIEAIEFEPEDTEGE